MAPNLDLEEQGKKILAENIREDYDYFENKEKDLGEE